MKLVIKLNIEDIDRLSKGEEIEVKLTRTTYDNLDGIYIRKERDE